MTKRVLLMIEFDFDAHMDRVYQVEYIYGNMVIEDPDTDARIEGKFYDKSSLKTYINGRIDQLAGM